MGRIYPEIGVFFPHLIGGSIYTASIRYFPASKGDFVSLKYNGNDQGIRKGKFRSQLLFREVERNGKGILSERGIKAGEEDFGEFDKDMDLTLVIPPAEAVFRQTISVDDFRSSSLTYGTAIAE